MNREIGESVLEFPVNLGGFKQDECREALHAQRRHRFKLLIE